MVHNLQLNSRTDPGELGRRWRPCLQAQVHHLLRRGGLSAGLNFAPSGARQCRPKYDRKPRRGPTFWRVRPAGLWSWSPGISSYSAFLGASYEQVTQRPKSPKLFLYINLRSRSATDGRAMRSSRRMKRNFSYDMGVSRVAASPQATRGGPAVADPGNRNRYDTARWQVVKS